MVIAKESPFFMIPDSAVGGDAVPSDCRFLDDCSGIACPDCPDLPLAQSSAGRVSPVS